MARGTDIDQFPAKLKRAMDRANMSRAQLAQAVGADKSVIARWLSGAINPADHSLSAISVSLALHIPGFSRADWALTQDGFAARLGITAASGGPLLQAGASAPSDDTVIADYAGLWAMTYLGLDQGRAVQHQALDLYGATGRLMFDFGVGTRIRSAGPVQVLDQVVYVMAHTTLPRVGIVVYTLQGAVPGVGAMMLDGIMMGRAWTRLAPIVAARIIAFRLAGPAIDDAARQRRFVRAAAVADELTARRPAAPARLVTVLQQEISDETAGAVLRVAAHRSWTRSPRDMMHLPENAAEVEAAAWVNGLYRAAVDGD